MFSHREEGFLLDTFFTFFFYFIISTLYLECPPHYRGFHFLLADSSIEPSTLSFLSLSLSLSLPLSLSLSLSPYCIPARCLTIEAQGRAPYCLPTENSQVLLGSEVHLLTKRKKLCYLAPPAEFISVLGTGLMYCACVCVCRSLSLPSPPPSLSLSLSIYLYLSLYLSCCFTKIIMDIENSKSPSWSVSSLLDFSL